MVIKVYISSVTCNNQQRKNQHTILSKLQAEKINYVKIDITDPKLSAEKSHMREYSKSRKEGTFPLPPQVFNDSEYCGDYDAFADALETQNLWEFLKLDYGLHREKEYIDPDAEPEEETSKTDIVKDSDNVKELQDQMKQKIEDDSLIGFKKEGEDEEKKDEEGGEKTNEEEEKKEEEVVETLKEGDKEEEEEMKEESREEEAVKEEEGVKEELKEEEREKKEEKEEDTKETETEEKSDEVEKEESKPEESEAQE